MKFGVKTYSEEDFLDYFIDSVDFFEIQGLRNRDYSFIRKYKNKMPIVVHAEHFKQGSNPADTGNYKENLESINFAKKISDMALGKIIILHPGAIVNENCSKENAIKFIKNIKDNRIVLENLPFKKDRNQLCTTPEEMKEFLDKTNKGFNFDLGHALVSANWLEENHINFIKKFLELNPRHFHISGQKLKAMEDLHLALNKSDINWKKILRLYPKNAEITLEVSSSIEETEKDLEFIRNVLADLK